MSFTCKVYVVQKADLNGVLGAIVAVKLTHADAHAIAKDCAPAKVLCVVADKSPEPNAVGPIQYRLLRNQLQCGAFRLG
jgi:hypothetical protein